MTISLPIEVKERLNNLAWEASMKEKRRVTSSELARVAIEEKYHLSEVGTTNPKKKRTNK